MFFPPGESLLVPLRLQQSQNDCRWDLLGSGGDRVAGMVYLEAYVGNCPTLFVRSNETPWWSECVVFWESSAWVGLQWWPHPLQVMALISVIHERYSFWKGSRCFFFFPPLLLCMCWELLGASFVFVGGMWNSIFQETSKLFYEV